MENFDRENIDELLENCQIRQYFPPSKFCAVWYIQHNIINNDHTVHATPAIVITTLKYTYLLERKFQR